MHAAAETTIPPFLLAADLPAIGAPLLDGIFAGISLHEHERVALVLLEGEVEKTHKAGLAWAAERSAVLPSRIDLCVLYANVRDQFPEEWYWSGETHPRLARYAWVQYFGYGYQFSVPKDLTSRCRAVRRAPIR